jgi:hypothetical protein
MSTASRNRSRRCLLYPKTIRRPYGIYAIGLRDASIDTYPWPASPTSNFGDPDARDRRRCNTRRRSFVTDASSVELRGDAGAPQAKRSLTHHLSRATGVQYMIGSLTFCAGTAPNRNSGRTRRVNRRVCPQGPSRIERARRGGADVFGERSRVAGPRTYGGGSPRRPPRPLSNTPVSSM